MQSNFGKHHSAVIYLQNTWLQHKEKFISAWADCYLHLGSRNTSRVEGANAVLKMYLNNSSVGDLQTVHDKFTIAIRNQKIELEIQQGKERNQSLHLAKKKIFTELDGKITHFALKEIQKQLDKLLNSTVEEPLQPCQQTFSRAMGLPWAHRLHDILEADGVIPLADIDSFWYIMNDNVPPLEQPGGTRSTYFDNAIVLMQSIQESLPTVNQARAMVVQQHLHRAAEALSQPILPPVRQKIHRRPTGATNKTRRDPCGFEVAMVLPATADGPVNNRLCSYCNVRGTGHNSASCPLRRSETQT